MGFSINTLTLLALVLAIGLVVDDAIVVLENIYRHIEEGMAPFQAAITGAKEVGFAVVAMTLTLAAVFAPLAVHAGPHGPAVQRVCAGAGGLGAGIGFRGADAVADDVLQAAQAQPPTLVVRPLDGGPAERADRRLCPCAALDAGPPLAGGVGDAAERRGHRGDAGDHQERAGAAGRPGCDSQCDQRPRRRHAGLHQPLRQRDGKNRPRLPGVRPGVCGGG